MSTPPDTFFRSAGFTRGAFSNPALLYAAVGSVCGSEEGEMGPGGEELEMKGTAAHMHAHLSLWSGKTVTTFVLRSFPRPRPRRPVRTTPLRVWA
jgi:hypothetical protein